MGPQILSDLSRKVWCCSLEKGLCPVRMLPREVDDTIEQIRFKLSLIPYDPPLLIVQSQLPFTILIRMVL